MTQGHTACLIIDKHIDEDLSFWVLTQDCTAESPSDYANKCELMTMKHNEKERVIQIMTYEKENLPHDLDFTV